MNFLTDFWKDECSKQFDNKSPSILCSNHICSQQYAEKQLSATVCKKRSEKNLITTSPKMDRINNGHLVQLIYFFKWTLKITHRKYCVHHQYFFGNICSNTSHVGNQSRMKCQECFTKRNCWLYWPSWQRN